MIRPRSIVSAASRPAHRRSGCPRARATSGKVPSFCARHRRSWPGRRLRPSPVRRRAARRLVPGRNRTAMRAMRRCRADEAADRRNAAEVVGGDLHALARADQHRTRGLPARECSHEHFVRLARELTPCTSAADLAARGDDRGPGSSTNSSSANDGMTTRSTSSSDEGWPVRLRGGVLYAVCIVSMFLSTSRIDRNVACPTET